MTASNHVVSVPTPPFRIANGALEVHQVVAWQDNLIWLLVCTATGAAAVVDGPEADPLLRYCDAKGITLTSVYNTHTHHDHVGINYQLAEQGRLDALEVVGPALVRDQIPGLTRGVHEGDIVELGAARGQVMLTEGHIDGHVSYVFDGAIFCGDTMFGAGCGYLFDGPPSKMHESLSRIAKLDDATRVCCAHEYTEDNLRFAWTLEPDNEALASRIRETWQLRSQGQCSVPSTIAVERATNPFLRHHSDTLRKNLRAAMPDHPLESACQVFAATRALKDRKDYRKLDDNRLPL
jgi:hydroxyacylglutathione hydrolase